MSKDGNAQTYLRMQRAAGEAVSFGVRVETEVPVLLDGSVGLWWWWCGATHDDQMVHRGVDGGWGGVSAPRFH